MTFRSFITRWVLRLHRRPFVWLYHFYYWLAVQCSRLLIRRVPGVRSIYLTGSWVRRDILYGLSDLDFKVFVAGPRDPGIQDLIRRRFAWLRRFFPMLGSPDEKGVYFLDAFEADYRNYPLVRHLFDARYFRHQRIWGEDLIPRLPIRPWTGIDQEECAFARLRDWIERIHLCTDHDRLEPIHRQHLFFKAISDVALLAIRIGDPDFAFSGRAEILDHLSREMEEPYRRWIRNLISENRMLYRRRLNSDDENFQLFKKVVAYCSDALSASAPRPSIPLEIEESFQRWICRDDADAAAMKLQELSPYIRKVTVFPWCPLPINPWDFDFFGRPAYLLECSDPMPLDEFRSLRDYCRKVLHPTARVVLKEYDAYVSTVDANLVDHWGSFRGSTDLMYAFLGNNATGAQAVFDPQGIRHRMTAFREQLEAALRHSDAGRMDPSVFPFFLFNALRMLILEREFGMGRWRRLPTADAVVEFLNRHTPLNPSFSQKLMEQYVRAVRHGGSFDERLLPKSRALLLEMLEIAARRKTWDSLEKLNTMPDARYLAVTVAVATRDRPRSLERCLNSIARLIPAPSELIIVDSGGISSSQRIVDKLHLPFPVQLLKGERIGIAAARNMAVRAAKGEIIAFVDDDACVSPDWLDFVERAFLRDPRIGLVSGAILNMPCDRNDPVSQFMGVMQKL